MRVKIGWWNLLYVTTNGEVVTKYNYHVLSYNGYILLSTSQGYSNKAEMFHIIDGVFPKAKVNQECDRYTQSYIQNVQTNIVENVT